MILIRNKAKIELSHDRCSIGYKLTKNKQKIIRLGTITQFNFRDFMALDN